MRYSGYMTFIACILIPGALRAMAVATGESDRSEDLSRRLEVRNVDHLAVNAECPRVGIGLERGDDLARVLDLGRQGRIGAVDDGDLVGVNGEAADEAIAPGAPAILLEPAGIAEVGEHGVDRRDFSGRRREQALGAGQLIGKGPGAVGLLVVG